MRFIVPTVLSLMLVVTSCDQKSSMRIAEFSEGIRYERLESLRELHSDFVPRGIIVSGLVHEDSDTVLVPGDVLWCQESQGIVFGEKQSFPDPLAGTFHKNHRWGFSGYFAIEIEPLKALNLYDDGQLESVVTWFSKRKELDRFRSERNQ